MEEFKAIVVAVRDEYVLIECTDPLQSRDNRLYWEHYSTPINTGLSVEWRLSHLDERCGIHVNSWVTFRTDGAWVYTSDYERELSYAEISRLNTRSVDESISA